MRLALLLLAIASPAFADKLDASLAKDGSLVAGTATAVIEYDELDGPAHTKVEVVSLGGKRQGVYVLTERTEGEDPPSRHQVFLYDGGKLVPVFNQVVATQRIAFSKLGTGRYLEDPWSACGRAAKSKQPKRAPIDTITLKLRGQKLVETRQRSKQVAHCDELSACPFVYEVKAGVPQLVGEVLRDVRYTPALQGLSIGHGAGAVIRLTEEKPEVTFLDEIYLDVDGRRVAPLECFADPTLAYCAADGRYHVMTTGAVLPLHFEAKAGMRQVFARGYYTPTDVADRNAGLAR